MLKMKKHCQRCRTSLAPQGPALICSYECTFCNACGEVLAAVCPNCDGELVPRPMRTRAPIPVAADLLRRRFGDGRGSPKP